MSEQRIITIASNGCVNVKTVDPDINYCHRYVLTPGSDLSDQPADVVEAANIAWTPEVIAARNLAHPPPTAEELAQQALIRARYEAKTQSIIDNLPSWSAVSTSVDNISNLAKAKVFLKKLARITYWLAKDSEA